MTPQPQQTQQTQICVFGTSQPRNLLVYSLCRKPLHLCLSVSVSAGRPLVERSFAAEQTQTVAAVAVEGR